MVCLIRVIKVLCFVLVVLTYLLIYVIQHSIIKNVTVIPNGPSKAAKAKSEKAVTLPPRVSQLVGSTLETWFRTNLNATPCHSPQFTLGNKDPELRPFWQPLSTKVLLHSAFMDDRTVFQNVKYRFVRILGLKQGRDDFTTFYCRLISTNNRLLFPDVKSYIVLTYPKSLTFL